MFFVENNVSGGAVFAVKFGFIFFEEYHQFVEGVVEGAVQGGEHKFST
jgi:hypothetical protein